MKKNRLLLSIAFLFSLNASFAQKQNVYYVKDNGSIVSTKDSANYVRIISEPDSGTTMFNIKEYYLDGKIKFIGKNALPDKPLLHGRTLSFYHSGKRQQIANYNIGALDGDVFDFYPNGILYRVKRYSNSLTIGLNDKKPLFTIASCQDSLGKELVTDGNGYYTDYYPDFKRVHEEGMLKEGLRTGEWKGSGNEEDSILFFTEKYNKGKLLEGISKGINGKTYTYHQRDTHVMFKHDETMFQWYLSNNLKYTQKVMENNIHTFTKINFKIDKDGALSTINTDGQIEVLNQEISRVVSSTKGGWQPASRFGKTKETNYYVTLSFMYNSKRTSAFPVVSAPTP